MNTLSQVENLDQINEHLVDEIIKELVGVISLTQVIYGDSHWKLAWAHTNLALTYLELKQLPKQAMHHCERAFQVLTDEIREQSRRSLLLANSDIDESEEFYNPDSCRHQMILNYVYGKSCTLLKK